MTVVPAWRGSHIYKCTYLSHFPGALKPLRFFMCLTLWGLCKGFVRWKQKAKKRPPNIFEILKWRKWVQNWSNYGCGFIILQAMRAQILKKQHVRRRGLNIKLRAWQMISGWTHGTENGYATIFHVLHQTPRLNHNLRQQHHPHTHIYKQRIHWSLSYTPPVQGRLPGINPQPFYLQYEAPEALLMCIKACLLFR